MYNKKKHRYLFEAPDTLTSKTSEFNPIDRWLFDWTVVSWYPHYQESKKKTHKDPLQNHFDSHQKLFPSLLFFQLFPTAVRSEWGGPLVSARLSKQHWVQSAVINRRSPNANKHTSAQTSNSHSLDWGSTQVNGRIRQKLLGIQFQRGWEVFRESTQ